MYQPAPQGKDPHLWQLARKRASFKHHLAMYLVINIFLWLTWFFSGAENDNGGLPWPACASIGWGIVLFFHFLGDYVNTGYGSVEKEYEQLQNKK